jgi:hypothetical protein
MKTSEKSTPKIYTKTKIKGQLRQGIAGQTLAANIGLSEKISKKKMSTKGSSVNKGQSSLMSSFV